MRPERTPGTEAYYQHRHALCKPCRLFFTWKGRQPIRDAECSGCGRPLSRTAGALLALADTRTKPKGILAVGRPQFRS